MIVSTRDLTYIADKKVFVGEASTLRLGNGNDPHQLYQDACDIGLTLISHKTHKEVTFYMDPSSPVVENGEVTMWVFYPTTETERAEPALVGSVIKVYND